MKSFFYKPLSNLATFEHEMPCLSITSAQRLNSFLFQIFAEKNLPSSTKTILHFLYTFDGWAKILWKNLWIHSISAGKKIRKMTEFCFWANVLLRGLFKSGQGRGCFIPKTLQGLHFFTFWSIQLVHIFLSYFPVKQIWRKNRKNEWTLKCFKIFVQVTSRMVVGFEPKEMPGNSVR